MLDPKLTMAPEAKPVPAIVSTRSPEPATALDGERVVMLAPGAGLTRIEKDCVVVCVGFEESVTWTVKFDVPAAVGVPLTTPDVLRSSPAGSAPAEIEKL